MLNIVVVILGAVLVGCLVYVIRTLSKMNATSKRVEKASMGAFEAAPLPRKVAAPSPVTPQPSQSFAAEPSTDLPQSGEPAAKDQMVNVPAEAAADAQDTPAVVKERPTSASASVSDEQPVEDHARQSTGVSDSEKIHGKTMALSSFDFDKLLAERKNKKSGDS